MQKLVRVKLSVEEYVREEFHKQMRPPPQSPNCGRFRLLWAHAYCRRYTTGRWQICSRLPPDPPSRVRPCPVLTVHIS